MDPQEKECYYLYNFPKDMIYVMEIVIVRNMHFILYIGKNIL